MATQVEGNFMLKMILAAVALVVALAAPATAQQLSGTQISQEIANKTFTLQSGATVKYGPGNVYSYTRGGQTSIGTYEVKGSQICVTFGSNQRCDGLLRDANGLSLQTARGPDRMTLGSSPIQPVSGGQCGPGWQTCGSWCDQWRGGSEMCKRTDSKSCMARYGSLEACVKSGPPQ